MGYNKENKSSKFNLAPDRTLAEFLEAGIKEWIAERFKKNNKNNVVYIVIEEFTDEDIDNIVESCDWDEDGCHPSWGMSETYINQLTLTATTINYDTLYRAIQVNTYDIDKTIKRAHFSNIKGSNQFKQRNLIVYYRNIEDIDFTNDIFDGFELWSYDSDNIRDAFAKRNIGVLIKEYGRLKDRVKDAQRYKDEAVDAVERFESKLTAEELLAVKTADI